MPTELVTDVGEEETFADPPQYFSHLWQLQEPYLVFSIGLHSPCSAHVFPSMVRGHIHANRSALYF